MLLREDHDDVYNSVVFSKRDIRHSVKDIVHKLQQFTLVKTIMPLHRSYQQSNMFDGLVPELLYQADSLFAPIAPRRAVLFQKEPQLFTSDDLALKEIVLTLYPTK
jgi:hypothetical protein